MFEQKMAIVKARCDAHRCLHSIIRCAAALMVGNSIELYHFWDFESSLLSNYIAIIFFLLANVIHSQQESRSMTRPLEFSVQHPPIAPSHRIHDRLDHHRAIHLFHDIHPSQGLRELWLWTSRFFVLTTIQHKQRSYPSIKLTE